MVFVVCGLRWVMPKLVIVLLQCWSRKPTSFRNRVSNVVLLYLMWNIWEERNRQTFEGLEHSIERIKFAFACFLFLGMLLEEH